MYCLWCHEEMIPEITWRNVFQFFADPPPLCTDCQQKLPLIEGPVCPGCSRPSKTRPSKTRPSEKENLCPDCLKWNAHPNLSGMLKQNVSVYSYSAFMKEVMAKWKYRGDYELVHMFKNSIQKRYKEQFPKQGLTAVPIPLSEARQKERGFNQAEALAGLLKLPLTHALTRIKNEKQAKKSRAERLKSSNPFQITQAVQSPVLLIDDLYTTGATLHWAASLLKSNGTPEIYSFTLIRS
ncbi:ComF family protein [Virgibacillus sp. MSP4-1]|uniref:ComF family protein n=1 Tax=Virgibacillus sp. MSP4-1 TaxID=2700081 RepID=UPI0003A178AA|nr:ComF family protein [Virgibacillus sp. MSP4-1]QHS23297.1 ComF family protein [Virgibacillus sp. MSP4-1]